jgi:hypothetical protein
MNAPLPSMIAAVLVAAAACGDSSTQSGNAATRDSAGITIVENTAPSWTDADAWHLSETPTLTLGSAEGDSSQEFYQVAGMARLSDGTIVVANNGSSELRYFSPDGTLRARAGHKGGGPGEFQMLMSLQRLPGDSLLAYDLMNRRLSVFDRAGRHGRDIAMASTGPVVMMQIAGRFKDGRYLALSPNTSVGPAMLSRPVGPARDSTVVLLLDTAATIADTLGLFPGARVNVRNMEMLGRSFPMPVPVPFSPSTVIAAGDSVAYVGTSDTYEIRVLAPDGTLRRLIRYAQPPRPVTDADKEAYAERLKDFRMPGPANAMMDQFRKAMTDVEYPETMPAYGQISVDADQNLWVADVTAGSDAPTRWSVFDPQGRLRGFVTTPPRFQVRDIGADYVLGAMTDETEIERVLLYQLIKPSNTKEAS